MATKLLNDSRLLSIIEEVLPDKDPSTGLTYVESLRHKQKNNHTEEFFIPVLGMQGTGKSSFLNALLMDDFVLPVDADETTCVPVEIRYGNKKEIVVHFEDKAPINLSSAKEIEQYVHNAHNPANEKKVKMIQLYKKHDLLKNGVVFVDLPGVGSITKMNAKTTMDYIEKLSAAIFMLRTVPPITAEEANFLKMVWPKLSKAWFVQNQWHDESTGEVEDGLQHNKYILEKIGEMYKIENKIDIRVLNVYAALTGRLTRNDSMVNASGIPKFEHFIHSITSNWPNIIQNEMNKQQHQAIQDVIQALEHKIELYDKEPEVHYEYLREQEDLLQQNIDENNSVLNQLKLDISKDERALKSWIEDNVTIAKENLRAEIQRIVKSNVVDGNRLATAFNDLQKDYTNEVVAYYLERVTDIKLKVQETYNDLNIRTPTGEFTKFEEFYKTSSTKFEKTLPTIGGLAGGLGVILLSSNPLGWAALGATAVVGLIGSFIGKTSKNLVQKNRQNTTMQELEQPISRFASNLTATLNADLTEFIQHVHQTLTQIHNEQEAMLEKAYEELREIRFAEINEYKEKQQKLKDDLQYICSLEGLYESY
ncbi:dynamin family protein [Metasolibacillus meyeri]|uniref:dynamin family protein n=1 Tax=Metasolibacillus meyeri TaxID=1071052 RepID=UPI00187D5C47|nr:dynamin family protein [Metasolibacillus meyeri]